MSESPVVKLELSLEKVNVIMNALAQMPYVQVQPIIEDIQKQAQVQLQAAQPDVAETSATTIPDELKKV